MPEDALRKFIVSRHHVWAGPASYAQADRDVCVCTDCGQFWRAGRQNHNRLPRCKPRIEAAGSGYRGWTIGRYMAAHHKTPAAFPIPGGLLFGVASND